MHQYFLVEVECLVNPLQSLLQFWRFRHTAVYNRQEIHFESVLPLDSAQFSNLVAKVDNPVDARLTYIIEILIR